MIQKLAGTLEYSGQDDEGVTFQTAKGTAALLLHG
jgi:hypothetical protein